MNNIEEIEQSIAKPIVDDMILQHLKVIDYCLDLITKIHSKNCLQKNISDADKKVLFDLVSTLINETNNISNEVIDGINITISGDD